jgi:hypothetical protein
VKRWSDLAKAALLGTSRAPVPTPPAPGTPLDTLLSQLEGETAERRLLGSAALLAVWRQAGAQPLSAHATLPVPAPPDDGPPCPAHTSRHLAQILQGDMGSVLEEWLGALADAGRSLPHHWLPELLDLACQKRDLRPLIVSLLDARGRWLAAQHPQWQRLVIPPAPEAESDLWETGSRQTRLALLRHLRATTSGAAEELVGDTWSEEPAKDRAAFLEVFAIGLNPADEPFLESALGDRSKQVRTVAADLLARLPSSQMVKRMQTRLEPLLGLERRMLGQVHLRVSLPEAYDAGMMHDGIEKRSPAGLGQRAWWLLQMLAAVPPATWSQAWGKPPRELIGLAGKADEEPLLLEGWSRATARHGDGEWAAALLQRWGDRPWSALASGKPLYFLDDLDDLILAAPQKPLESWLANLLRTHHRSLDETDAPLTLLLHYRRPWGRSLTRVVLSGMRILAAQQKPSHAAWRWRSALTDFAHYASPAVADEAEAGWPSEGTWTGQIDRFLTILRFRRDMLTELQRGG